MTEQQIIKAIKYELAEIKKVNPDLNAFSLQESNDAIRSLIVRLMNVTKSKNLKESCKLAIVGLNSADSNELYGAKFSQSQMDRFKASGYHKKNYKKYMSDAIALISDSTKFIDNL